MKIYQAGPLFTEGEQMWHKHCKAILESHGHEVIWPFELFTQEDVIEWGADAPKRIMEIDKEALEKCKIVVALLDGPMVDDGTAWEIGYAYAQNKPIIGIRTDFRQGGDTSHSVVNAMIEGSCELIVKTIDELVEALSTRN